MNSETDGDVGSEATCCAMGGDALVAGAVDAIDDGVDENVT